MQREIDSETVIKPAAFAHIVLRVANLQESIAWYATVLGTEVVHQNDFIAFISYDAEHHRLALAQIPDAERPPKGTTGLEHFAYTLRGLGELLGTYERLKAKGIEPTLTINHGPTTSIYYADPDGHGVEFTVDNYETEAELKGWMHTEAFAENPRPGSAMPAAATPVSQADGLSTSRSKTLMPARQRASSTAVKSSFSRAVSRAADSA